MAAPINSVLALDVGGKRIGVAAASLAARLPHPLTTLTWGDSFFDDLQKIIDTEKAGLLVVGLPRSLEGRHTAQTKAVEDFVSELREHISLPVHMQDEAVTSRQAEEELKSRGKTYDKGQIDALAATYILDDWLAQHRGVEG